MISSSRNEEMSSGTDEMEAELDAGLRKFHNHSENFAIPTKISLCTVFR